MPEIVVLTVVAAGTALATGLGALPVLWLGTRVEAAAPAVWGAAGGVMAVAAVLGLLVPAVQDGSSVSAAGGLAAGVALLMLARRSLARREDLRLGTLSGAGARRGVLVAATMFAHSLPEGLAIGAAWASGDAAGVFVVLAVAIQNVPEGMVTAVGLVEARWRGGRVFWAAVATSTPQIPGAVLAFLAVTTVTSVLGFSFGLAAGAMLALIALEVVPAARVRPLDGAAGAAAGAATMAVLAVVLGA